MKVLINLNLGVNGVLYPKTNFTLIKCCEHIQCLFLIIFKTIYA